MPTPPVPPSEVHRRVSTYQAVVAEGFVPLGQVIGLGKKSALLEAAYRLGIGRQALADTLRRSLPDIFAATPPPPPPPPSPPPPAQRAEARDASYWRTRATKLTDELADREADLKAALGMLERPVQPPQWLAPEPGAQSRTAGLLHISDLHVGEVVRPDEIASANEYDPDVFVRRIRRLFSASLEILPRWSADSHLRGVVIAVNGDLVSGDIHDELRRTNAIPAIEQVYLCADELTAGIEHMAAKFGAVWVTFTPGNHGRSTEKTHAKRTSALSYDMLIGEMVRRHFVNDTRVTVLLATGPDLEYPVLGWRVFQSHGDALGTGGGKGFAGPVLPIARGAKNVEWQAYRLHKRHDIILTAHYHTSSNPARGVLANGSVVGFNEYANRIRAGIEPPQQWLALIHERWGIRERCEIQLEDAGPPEKPRVRVPVEMRAA